jgi:ribosome-binding factor A
VYGDDAAREGSAVALASATGVVRAEVGKALGVRFTPTIAFVADAVPETARAIDHLLDAARRADAQLTQVRVGKAPAGEADPYRRRDGTDGNDGSPAGTSPTDGPAR